MRKPVLILTTTAAIFASGVITASAQVPGAQTPSAQQSPTTQATPGGSMQQQDQTRLQRRAQIEEDSDQGGFLPRRNDARWNDGTGNDEAGLWSRHHESHGDANNFQSDGR